MEIADKVFIVTGGASGLGEGTARMLAGHGGKVVIADLQADRGTAVAAEIGGRFVSCDVSREEDGQRQREIDPRSCRCRCASVRRRYRKSSIRSCH